jgi:hypothetical protein
VTPTPPAVSIITPAFNAAAFLQQTIHSVLEQTFADFELIVVDDGSTDDTIAIARRAAAADPRIRVLSSPHGGPAAARNVGLRAARGRLVALLDADDLWWPEYLDEQVALLDAHPDVAAVSANALSLGGVHDGKPVWPATTGVRRLHLRDLLAEENAVCIMTVFRRESVAGFGGFDPAFTGNEDYQFWLEMTLAAGVILQNRAPHGHYRRRAGSVSDDEPRMLRGMIRVLTAIVPRLRTAEERAIAARQIARFRRELRVASIKRRMPGWMRRVARTLKSAAVFAALAMCLVARPASANTIAVPAGGDLAGAIIAAKPGDTIALEAGATYAGNFLLPRKDGDAVITIQTKDATSEENARMSPQAASALAKLRSPNAQAVIRTAPGAHHWRLTLLEIQNTAEGRGDIVELGSGGAEQRTLADVPHDLVIDRCYIHGDAASGQRRCVALNSAATTVSNSYISDCKRKGDESQAIAGWNGPGPFTIANNYLEAAAENVIFGGADPTIDGLVPSDIRITGNLLSRPVAWRQEGWEIKNILELKNARRVTIDGNVLENNWQSAQAGYAVLFTVRNQDGRCPWCEVSAVSFEHNILRHSAAGISILGVDNNHPSKQTEGITVRGNLFVDIDNVRWGGNGYCFMLTGQPKQVTIDHNTIIQEHASGIVLMDTKPVEGFAFTNNVARHMAYGIFGDGHKPGNDSIAAFLPGARIEHNVIADANASLYPTGNLFPSTASFRAQFKAYDAGDYQLTPSSAWRGAGGDGKDLGADIGRLPAHEP